jgi:type II secretory pathway pseudopilin PulG
MMRMIRNERGFTLAEILVGAVVVAVGIVGLFIVIPLAGFGIQQGNQMTTATFLAQQRLEQVRNTTWTCSTLDYSTTPATCTTTAVDCLGTSSGSAAPTTSQCNVTPCTNGTACTTFADESSTAISGFSGYSRTVRITDCSVSPGCGTTAPMVSGVARLATVGVTFTPSTGVGAGGTGRTFTVSLDLLVSQR